MDERKALFAEGVFHDVFKRSGGCFSAGMTGPPAVVRPFLLRSVLLCMGHGYRRGSSNALLLGVSRATVPRACSNNQKKKKTRKKNYGETCT